VIDGSKPKRTVDTGIGDITGSTVRVHGYSVVAHYSLAKGKEKK
jgi:hypothetical protein